MVSGGGGSPNLSMTEGSMEQAAGATQLTLRASDMIPCCAAVESKHPHEVRQVANGLWGAHLVQRSAAQLFGRAAVLETHTL